MRARNRREMGHRPPCGPGPGAARQFWPAWRPGRR